MDFGSCPFLLRRAGDIAITMQGGTNMKYKIRRTLLWALIVLFAIVITLSIVGGFALINFEFISAACN